MAGDYTRFRYNPLKDTTGVLVQQGRVLLDQDWNEYVQLQDRRWRAETIDIIGRAVVPAETPQGFELKFVGGKLTIGIGHMYVDGLIAENHGIDPTDPTKRKYDPVLGELIGRLPIPYDQQPYLLSPDPLPTGTDPHVVYLDVWERELTYLEDAGLVDQAVAVDTATRIQTVWQVKVLADSAKSVDCPAPLPDSLISPSAGQLTTKAAGVPSSTDPCIVPANGGYRGSGNRCYRIEIHTGGALGTAQFKWSRDNASVASAVTGINASLDTLTVVLTKRDSVLRFQPNDWVEVTDDFRYFAGLSGEMRQVAVVDDVNLTIQLKTPLPVGEFDATKPERHTRAIRWDQSGIVRDPVGNVIVDVDTNGGLIPVPAAGTTLVLEDGIQVTFDLDPAISSGVFKIFDDWIFSARVIDASVELLDKAPPFGIHHHFAKLGFINSTTVLSDCRVIWPPASGESCDCSVCVSAVSHNSGTLTLNTAISQVQGKGGGKVCLGPGIYNITETVNVGGPNAIEISGHGLPSLAAGAGLSNQKPIMQIEGAVDVTVGDIAFVGPGATPNQPSIPGLVVVNSMFVRINRCLFSGSPSVAGAGPETLQDTLSPAIGIAGFVWGAAIRDNFFNTVKVGIGPAPDVSPQAPAPFLAYSSMQNNEMACTNAGVMFSDPKRIASFLEVSFADNSVASPIGFQMSGFGLDVAIERNSFVVISNSAFAPSPVNAAIASSASQARISNNQISGDSKNPGRDGIVLDWTTAIYGTHVVGNHIDGLSGTGILVTRPTVLLETIISQNQLLNLGGAGIKLESGSRVVDLKITGNSLANLGLAQATTLDLVGIELLATSFNVNLSENVIEVVGPNLNANTSRMGILLNLGADVRIAGNRIVDIGPPGAVNFSAGIALLAIVGRVDIVDNEVRRASVPPASNTDASPWSALLIGVVIGDVNVRGNLLESFGSLPTAMLLLARSCIFSDNQCFLDNSGLAPLPRLAVLLGANPKVPAGAIIASGNLVQVPVPVTQVGGSVTVMSLNPTSVAKSLTVLGNITSGLIVADGTPLGALTTLPWAPLNVINI
jgi:hypothetical protein